MYTDPQDGMQAKFSMEFCVAVALRNAGVGLNDFTPAAVRNPRFRDLMPLVHRHPVDKQESEFPTRVEIVTKSGATHTIEVDAPKGRDDNPMSDAELWDKLKQCCRGILDDATAAALATALDRLDGGSAVADLMRPLRFNHES
jgi:2-methylcitrate dehydratase PrpD